MAARAGETPAFAPTPAWVEPVAIPPTTAADGDQTVLLDRQERLSGSGDEYFQRSIVQLQSPQALQNAGTVSIAWDPATDDIVVHTVAIRRNGRTIDLLGAIPKLTVLRRETNLDSAMLDGRLTGTLQAEGLQTGDQLVVAYTLHRRQPTFGNFGASIVGGVTSPAVKSFVRESWSSTEPYAFRVSRDLTRPKVRVRDGVSDIRIEQANPTPREVPGDAPARFQETGLVEVSSFPNWPAVSRLWAPLYAKAATLSAQSPLQTEVRRIMADEPTAADRARAALTLVQTQVRYLALNMDSGGYLPATADVTWQRRFGDCKAKTVLLLALLHEMGIAAQPALVSATTGEQAALHLPSPLAFDHVIVRAVIDGRTYWLDGTAIDGGPLADLPNGDFRVALPIDPGGVGLETLPAVVPSAPTLLIDAQLDIRGGTTLPAPTVINLTLTGRQGAAFAAALDALSPAKRKDMLRDAMKDRSEGTTVTDVSAKPDRAAGTTVLTMTGTQAVRWQQYGDGRRYLIQGTDTGAIPAITPRTGVDAGLPHTIEPMWLATRTTVLLPDGGKGFTTTGRDFTQSAAGLAFRRSVKLTGDRLVVENVVRSTTREITDADATAARGLLADLSRSTVYLTSATYTVGKAEAARVVHERPKTFDALLTRGYDFLVAGNYRLALDDLNAAVAQDPKSSLAVANRGIAYFWQQNIDAAAADFAAALKLDAKQTIALHGQALIARQRGDLNVAIDHLSDAIDLDKTDAWAIEQRAALYGATDRFDEALADYDTLIALKGSTLAVQGQRASLLMAAHRPDDALKTLDALVAASPSDPGVLLLRASALGVAKRDAAARKDYDALIALKPTVAAYLGRARLREATDPAGSLADAEAAVLLAPDSGSALAYRADRLLAQGSKAAAANSYDNALAIAPDDLDLLLGYARILLKTGDEPGALVQVAKARTLARSAEQLNSVCWWGATNGSWLEGAAAACDAALALAPQAPAILDSKGLVLLRLHRLAAARATYDAALAVVPQQAPSLYGRGLVRAMAGDRTGGASDRDRAIALDPDLPKQFAEYGLSYPAR